MDEMYYLELAFNGLKVLCPIPVPEGESVADRIEGGAAYYETKGFSRSAVSSFDAKIKAFDNPPQAAPQGFPAQSQKVCPVHGAEKLGSYNGNAECKVTMTQKKYLESRFSFPAREWMGKPFQGRDGNTRPAEMMMTCEWKAS